MNVISVKITNTWTGENEVITIKMERIKRYDERSAFNNASAKMLARQDFCKKHGIDNDTVGKVYRFEIV